MTRILMGIMLVFTHVLMSGCATTGMGNESLRNETEASVSQKIMKGKTTKTDVKAMFGSPISTSYTDGGLEIFTYTFDTMKLDASSYIPVVGSLGTSASGTRKELVILFDDNDVVKKFNMSESDVGAKSGIFNR